MSSEYCGGKVSGRNFVKGFSAILWIHKLPANLRKMHLPSVSAPNFSSCFMPILDGHSHSKFLFKSCIHYPKKRNAFFVCLQFGVGPFVEFCIWDIQSFCSGGGGCLTGFFSEQLPGIWPNLGGMHSDLVSKDARKRISINHCHSV